MMTFFTKLPSCLVALEACGTSHYWGRTLRALGHEVRLIPAGYVKPFVKRNKTDARDAAAICVAARRPDMRPVAVKSEEQQASRALERSRELLIKQRTQLMNSARAMMAEFGIVAAQGFGGFGQLTARLADDDPGLPTTLIAALRLLVAQLDALTPAIEALEDKIKSVAKADATMRRLSAIPGVGPITAHAVVAAIGDGRQFSSARDFAAWAGMTPRQDSSAGKRRMKGVSRQGESRLRKLFALGAATLMRNARSRTERATQWQRGVLARRPGAASDEGGGHGAGRQDGQNRLGGPRLGQRLRPARGRHVGGPKARLHPVSFDPSGRKEAEQGANGSDGKIGQDLGRDTPNRHRASKARRNAGNPIRDTHRGQRSCAAPKRPNT
jgi:transposase